MSVIASVTRHHHHRTADGGDEQAPFACIRNLEKKLIELQPEAYAVLANAAYRRELRRFDEELPRFNEHAAASGAITLCEAAEVDFPFTYNYNTSPPNTFNTKRLPAFPDRVLLNTAVRRRAFA